VGILIFKGLTARHLYKPFGVKGLIVDSCSFLRIGSQRGFTVPYTNTIVNILAVYHYGLVAPDVRNGGW
jgi:hypothetical protein